MIAFFDIDGTLISDRGLVPESAVNAIRKAWANGHLMYINTGRAMYDIGNDIRDIGFDGYICGCGTYIKCGDELILYQTVPKETCVRVARLFLECDMTPVYERYDALFMDGRARRIGNFDGLVSALRKLGRDIDRDASEPDFGFDKFVGWYDDKSDIERFKQEIEKDFIFIDRGGGFCEVTVKNLSKATGIKAVCDYHGLSIDDAIAIGDSMNDESMLLAVKHSVAMGNAVNEVIQMASFVTRDLYDAGIEYALQHFGLI